MTTQLDAQHLGSDFDDFLRSEGLLAVAGAAATKRTAARQPVLPGPSSHVWTFKPRFRRNAFGWRSQPAIARIKQAVSEIKKVARRDPALAAEGAVLFLERVSPALTNIDGSSGSIGIAVNRAIDALMPLVAAATVDAATRADWLLRLQQAHSDDAGYEYLFDLGAWLDDLARESKPDRQAP